MSELLLELHDVSKKYSKETIALFPTTLTLHQGITGLLGPNGAGKTTLLRLIATLLQPSSGTITFNGYDSVKQRKEFRKRLGYLPQKVGLYPNLTTREHLLYYASLKGLKGRTARTKTNELLEEVGLSNVADQNVGVLSGGMRQRIGIANALLGAPQLLVVDEPTAGLDPEERMRFRNTLERVSRSTIVVLSTHIIQDIELGCSHVIVVANGTTIANTSPQNLAKRAEGKTWEAVISTQQLNEVSPFLEITSLCYVSDNQVLIRFVGDRIEIGEKPTEPQLNDAYLLLMQGTREHY